MPLFRYIVYKLSHLSRLISLFSMPEHSWNLFVFYRTPRSAVRAKKCHEEADWIRNDLKLGRASRQILLLPPDARSFLGYQGDDKFDTWAFGMSEAVFHSNLEIIISRITPEPALDSLFRCTFSFFIASRFFFTTCNKHLIISLFHETIARMECYSDYGMLRFFMPSHAT